MYLLHVGSLQMTASYTALSGLQQITLNYKKIWTDCKDGKETGWWPSIPHHVWWFVLLGGEDQYKETTPSTGIHWRLPSKEYFRGYVCWKAIMEQSHWCCDQESKQKLSLSWKKPVKLSQPHQGPVLWDPGKTCTGICISSLGHLHTQEGGRSWSRPDKSCPFFLFCWKLLLYKHSKSDDHRSWLAACPDQTQ